MPTVLTMLTMIYLTSGFTESQYDRLVSVRRPDSDPTSTNRPEHY